MKKNGRVYIKKFFIIWLFIFFSQIFSGHNLKAQVSGEIKVEIKEVEPFVYCSLSRQGSFAEIEAAVGELLHHMQAQNVFPTGSMIGVFHSDPTMSDPEKIQWEV
ncbi:MAG: GyrI-like domain-containing protein, partial [Candidatus Aminicenantes bacterium]|nr:GyrI-like domain-containing protein [Candidatus Aminicenantes bacterium]